MSELLKVTTKMVSVLFNKYLLLDEKLRDNLKNYYEEKEEIYAKEGGKISEGFSPNSIRKKFKDDQYFKSVANHVTTYYTTGDISYLDRYRTGLSRKIKNLAKDFIRLYQLDTIKTTAQKISNTISISHDKNTKKGRVIDLSPVYRWDNLYNFIGRSDELLSLINNIEKNKYVVIGGSRGIGKTSLVQLYLKLHSGIYDHIIWVNVSSTIRKSFISTVSASPKIQEYVAKDINNAEEENSWFLKALETLKFKKYSGNNLLIIDNADSASQILDAINVFEGLNFNWRTIFVSSSGLSTPIPIEINQLSPRESFDLLKSYYTEDINPSEREQAFDFIKTNEEQIKTLLKNLNYNPLLIELIAKVDISDELLDLSDIQEIVKGVSSIKHEKLQKSVIIKTKNSLPIYLDPEKCTPLDYIKAIFEKDLINLNQRQKEVLQLFSILPNNYIPLEHLKIFFKGTYDVDHILSGLKPWIKINSENKSFIMDELYQFAIREILPIDRDLICSFSEKINSHIAIIDKTEKSSEKQIEVLKPYRIIVDKEKNG
jgi:hypothetical protein